MIHFFFVFKLSCIFLCEVYKVSLKYRAKKAENWKVLFMGTYLLIQTTRGFNELIYKLYGVSHSKLFNPEIIDYIFK